MARIEIGNVANSMEFAMTESKIPESAKVAVFVDLRSTHRKL